MGDQVQTDYGRYEFDDKAKAWGNKWFRRLIIFLAVIGVISITIVTLFLVGLVNLVVN